MDRFEIQKLRDLPIIGVAERLGLRVKRWRSICCFHDDHSPSMYFNVKRNTYRCFSCGAHGNVIDLAMHMLGKNFADTCQWLANENNIILSEYKPKTEKAHCEPQTDIAWLGQLVAHPHLNAEAQHFLFDERCIDPRVVRWLGLSSISSAVPMTSTRRGSWFNAPSLLIPYRDIDGNLMSVQARYLGNSAKSDRIPRFQFPRGSKCHIFNLPVLKMLREGEDLWIAEGCSDCMALLSSGRKAIAIPSATLLNRDDMHVLSSSLSPSNRLHIFPDQDEAGEKLFTDLVAMANDLRMTLVRHDLPIDCKDFGDYWQGIQQLANLELEF